MSVLITPRITKHLTWETLWFKHFCVDHMTKFLNFRYQPAQTGTYPELNISSIQFDQVWLEFS